MKLMRSDVSQGVSRGQRRTETADRPTFSISLRLPLECEALAAAPSDSEMERIEHANEATLDMLFTSADLGAAPIEDEALAEALRPLRVKIDMMVGMLARLSYRDRPLPEAREVEVGLSRLAWSQPEPLTPQSWLLVRLYFHELLREPVTLAGRVMSCTADPLTGGWRGDIAIADMSESLGESFARLVFLEHRRRLAHPASRAATSRSRA